MILNNTSPVILTDIETSNGVIHVIDTVLLPPAEAAAAPAALPATGGEMPASVYMFAAVIGLGLALLAGGLALRLRWNR